MGSASLLIIPLVNFPLNSERYFQNLVKISLSRFKFDSNSQISSDDYYSDYISSLDYVFFANLKREIKSK